MPVISVIPVRFVEGKKCKHYLYVKEHKVREDDTGKPKLRTLFVINIPPYCGQAALQHLFGEYGTIQKIIIQSNPSTPAPQPNQSVFFPDVTPIIEGFRVAYVVYKDKESVQKAMATEFKPKQVPAECRELTGLKKWCKEYSDQLKVMDVPRLEGEIEEYMKKYDAEQEEKAERLKQEALEPDEEGWVKVSRHGTVKGNPRTEEHEKHAKEQQKRKRKKQELSNFYSFQVRESKMKHVVKLRQQFKQDKEKVAKLKAARKFRPY